MAAAIWFARCRSVIRDGPAANTSGCEEISLFNISQIRAGEPAYADCFSATYRASLFNWLFYRSYGFVAQVINPSEWNLPTSLRLFTTAWAVLGGLATFVLVRGGWSAGSAVNPTAAWIIPAAIALVTWFGPVIGWWSLTARPDVAAACLETMALALVANRPAETSIRRALCAAMLFYLGWSFKQAAVTVFAGTALGLVVFRNWKAAFTMVVLFGAIAILTLAVADANYWNNTIAAHKLASWQLSVLKENLTGWFAAGAYLLFLIPALWWYGRMNGRDEAASVPVQFLTVVFAVCLLISIPASSRWGASRNYIFSAWVVGMTLSGIIQLEVLKAEISSPSLARGRWMMGTLYMLSLIVSAAYTAGLVFSQGKFGTLNVTGMDYSPEVIAAVRQSDRPAFIEDPTLVRLAMGDDAKNYPVLEEMIYTDAVRAGLIRDGGVGRRMENHYYRTLWLFRPHWAEKAIESGYEQSERRGSFVKYVPKRSN